MGNCLYKSPAGHAPASFGPLADGAAGGLHATPDVVHVVKQQQQQQQQQRSPQPDQLQQPHSGIDGSLAALKLAQTEAQRAKSELRTARQEIDNLRLMQLTAEQRAAAAVAAAPGASAQPSGSDAALVAQLRTNLEAANKRAQQADAILAQQQRQLDDAKQQIRELHAKLPDGAGRSPTSALEAKKLQQELASVRAALQQREAREAELASEVEVLRKEVASTHTLQADDASTTERLHQDLTSLRRDYSELQAEVRAKEDMFALLQTQLTELSDVDVNALISESRGASRRVVSRVGSLAHDDAAAAMVPP